MEAKDLRLGNYVRRKTINPDGIAEESYEVLVVNSSTISKLEVGPILSRADGYTVFVEPIQLTREWLLKLNFQDKYSEKRLYFRIKGMTIDIKNGDKFYYNNIHLKYVHQLQNLYFALMRKELTIEKDL